MATSTTSAPTSSQPGTSPGEELYLIHLRRESAACQAELYKHQALVGQELWKVHCQRSNGYDELDDESSSKPTTIKNNKKKISPEAVRAKKAVIKSAAAAIAAHKRYNLRSKDERIPKKKE